MLLCEEGKKGNVAEYSACGRNTVSLQGQVYSQSCFYLCISVAANKAFQCISTQVLLPLSMLGSSECAHEAEFTLLQTACHSALPVK